MPEQQASDNGAMDLFPKFTGTAGPPPDAPPRRRDQGARHGVLRRQHRQHAVELRPELRDERQLVDHAVRPVHAGRDQPHLRPDERLRRRQQRPSTLSRPATASPTATADSRSIGDTDPLGDVCSTAADQNTFAGKNVGDLLNAKGITWGCFAGGFDLTLTNANGTTGCARKHAADASSRPTASRRPTTSRTTSRSSTTRRRPTRRTRGRARPPRSAPASRPTA